MANLHHAATGDSPYTNSHGRDVYSTVCGRSDVPYAYGWAPHYFIEPYDGEFRLDQRCRTCLVLLALTENNAD